MGYTFREPSSLADWDALHALNHRIFAEELGQHGLQSGARLRDFQEGRGRYIIALKDGAVIGMVFAHTDAPFSVEEKLDAAAILDRLPPPLIEVRLLAIDAAHRSGMVLLGLLSHLLSDALSRREGTVIISGVRSRAAMYQRIGFRPLGPAVVRGKSEFIPMALRLDELPTHVVASLRRLAARTGK